MSGNRLLVPKGDSRIDRCGSPRWNSACQQRNEEQSQRSSDHEDRIARTRLAFGRPVSHEAAESNAEDKSQTRTNPHAANHGCKDKLYYVGARSPKSHSDPKLIGPLRHCVRDHAVKADRGQRGASAANPPKSQATRCPRAHSGVSRIH